ncbi:acyl-CoA dehydrogenase family protein, partial [uncultured Intestinimonas sp.]|uniref:acyl-CoA dehydrogenase family protein n=1 Tax=uncultured Intestinimonas sp. TaxID=1689265 RepID=UPI0025E13B99
MIDFALDSEHQELQEMYRKFAEERVKPLAHEMDEAEKYDMGLLKEMQECGFFGIPFSEAYGGAGGDVLSYVLCMEEMSKVDASTGITLSVHTSLCASTIEEFGTEE